ncbi:MAG: ABC transporter substrate-binding protein [Clostridiales bacterium]|jgi:NitT/TauT family transport system substrate-binding protein|nr:ABC transporter substrate-binding protein [Clostridiales bacterium]
MKRFISIILAAAFILSFAACSDGASDSQSSTEAGESAPKSKISVAALIGPTGMGLSKLITDVNSGEEKANDYTFTLMSSPDEIVSSISSGGCDIAACPLNLAATLYQKTSGDVQMIAVNTLGVMYVVENGSAINSIADLNGKTVYSSGQGSSPEYILNYILEANGLVVGKDVKVEYLGQHAELTSKAAADDSGIFVMPEPNVTTAMSKNSDLRIALDLTDEWDKACRLNGIESTLAQGCLIARKSFAAENADAINAFLGEYGESVDYVNAKIPESSSMIAELGIVPSAAIAQNAIPNCNIVCISGAEMKRIAVQNLEVLFKAKPQSVGGAMPDDDFWFAA